LGRLKKYSTPKGNYPLRTTDPAACGVVDSSIYGILISMYEFLKARIRLIRRQVHTLPFWEEVWTHIKSIPCGKTYPRTRLREGGSAAGLLILVIFIALSGFAFGEDIRSVELDMFIIIDGSSALSSGKDDAIQWLCDYAVDGMLQAGDRLTIWLASEPARRLFSETLTPDALETVKSLIRSINLEGESADYKGALQAAAENEASARGITYTLIVGGAQAGHGSFPGGEEAAALLRYCRVQEFPGWRVAAAAMGIDSRVRRAAAAFMD
jgi:hypothetical protein